jgi:hypothetical protein
MDEVGADQVRIAGIQEAEGRRNVTPLPFAEFADLCQRPPLPKYIAQIEIALSLAPDQETRFLQQFGLDQATIGIGTACPDLVEAIAPTEAGAPYRLWIWDFKHNASILGCALGCHAPGAWRVPKPSVVHECSRPALLWYEVSSFIRDGR